MINVLFNRLISLAGIDPTEVWEWDNSGPITIKDILNAKSCGLKGTVEPYGDTFKYPTKKRDRKYHISRIIHFIDHPEEISGIVVENQCTDDSILPGCLIQDGYHRIAAGMILHLKKVDIEYFGRSDIEDYITGKSNIRPSRILVLW